MKKNLFIIISFLFLMLLGIAFSKSPALAVSGGFQGPDLGTGYPATAGFSSLDPRIMVAQIVRIALGLLGTIFLVIVLYGGYLWMTAGGNEDQIGQAKSWIYSGVVGLGIILSAFAITMFVLESLTTATV
ncbi:MAG: hypothetical protein AAB467_03525 [Patescibacteria group bacterium]